MGTHLNDCTKQEAPARLGPSPVLAGGDPPEELADRGSRDVPEDLAVRRLRVPRLLLLFELDPVQDRPRQMP